MPPKAEDGVSEAYAKGLDRGLRGLLSVRALIWRTQAGREESAQLGVFNEELKHFLSAADEFLAPDDPEMASARARYAAIARHRLLRPQILALRGMKEGPVAPKELAPVVLAVLAAFAALFVWAKNKDSAAARPLQYYEAWLAAEPASLVAVTESSIRAYVSVLDFVEARGREVSTAVAAVCEEWLRDREAVVRGSAIGQAEVGNTVSGLHSD
jgi:hypothetical protein